MLLASGALALVVLTALATAALYHWTRAAAPEAPDAEAETRLGANCEQLIDRRFGKQLSLRYYDGLSSYEDASRQRFVAFYRAEVRPSPNQPHALREYLIRCEIAADGSVPLFEVNPHGVPNHYD